MLAYTSETRRPESSTKFTLSFSEISKRLKSVVVVQFESYLSLISTEALARWTYGGHET
jgi:hypothetical protein